MQKVLVSGSLAYDRIMDFPGNFADQVLPNKLHSLNVSFTIERLTENFGGTAGNVAYNLGLLGEQPMVIASVGMDFAKYKDHLTAAGVDVSLLRTIENDSTSSAFVFTDIDDNQIAAFYAGAAKRAYAASINTEGCKFAIISAGNTHDMAALSEKYKASGIKYLYDPGQQINTLTKDALCAQIANAWALFANDYELNQIMQRTGWQEKALMERVEVLVTTFGARGSTILTRDKVFQIPAVRTSAVIDPTGAGDAHRAGFIKAVLAGLSYEVAGRLASTVATYTVEVYGTQTHHFTMDQVKDRYRKAYGEELVL